MRSRHVPTRRRRAQQGEARPPAYVSRGGDPERIAADTTGHWMYHSTPNRDHWAATIPQNAHRPARRRGLGGSAAEGGPASCGRSSCVLDISDVPLPSIPSSRTSCPRSRSNGRRGSASSSVNRHRVLPARSSSCRGERLGQVHAAKPRERHRPATTAPSGSRRGPARLGTSAPASVAAHRLSSSSSSPGPDLTWRTSALPLESTASTRAGARGPSTRLAASGSPSRRHFPPALGREQQRVAVARALATIPVVLADGRGKPRRRNRAPGPRLSRSARPAQDRRRASHSVEVAALAIA